MPNEIDPAVTPPTTPPWTDLWAAEQFVAKYGHRVRFGAGRWHGWTPTGNLTTYKAGGVWLTDEGDTETIRCAMELARTIYAQAEEIGYGTPRARQNAFRFAKRINNSAGLHAMLRLARALAS